MKKSTTTIKHKKTKMQKLYEKLSIDESAIRYDGSIYLAEGVCLLPNGKLIKE